VDREDFMPRLALIRSIYEQALKQAAQPQPLNALSILMLHDSAELFLELAAEHKDCATDPRNIMPFMSYWGLLEPKLPAKGLTQRMAMDRLNRARISLKHHGHLPHESTIEQSRRAVSTFFDENTPLVFDLQFAEISMSGVVRHNSTRIHLSRAEVAMGGEDWATAAGEIAIALDDLIEYYERRGSSLFGPMPGPPLPHPLGVRAEELEKRLERTEHVLRLLTWGVDYRAYVQITWQLPAVSHPYGAKEKEVHPHSSDEAPTRGLCSAAYQFVIETALQLQALPLWRRRRRVPWGVLPPEGESEWSDIPADEVGDDGWGL
jgi:hypothetical protein